MKFLDHYAVQNKAVTLTYRHDLGTMVMKKFYFVSFVHCRLIARQIYWDEDYLSHHHDGSDNVHCSISDVQANVNDSSLKS